MLHNFLEFISTNNWNYQTMLTFSMSYYQAILNSFLNAVSQLLPNKWVHINQLLKLTKNTDFSRELVPSNIFFFRVHFKCWHFYGQIEKYRFVTEWHSADFFIHIWEHVLCLNTLVIGYKEFYSRFKASIVIKVFT